MLRASVRILAAVASALLKAVWSRGAGRQKSPTRRRHDISSDEIDPAYGDDCAPGSGTPLRGAHSSCSPRSRPYSRHQSGTSPRQQLKEQRPSTGMRKESSHHRHDHVRRSNYSDCEKRVKPRRSTASREPHRGVCIHGAVPGRRPRDAYRGVLGVSIREAAAFAPCAMFSLISPAKVSGSLAW